MQAKDLEELIRYKNKRLSYDGKNYYISFKNQSGRLIHVPITEEEAALIRVDRSELPNVLRKHRKTGKLPPKEIHNESIGNTRCSSQTRNVPAGRRVNKVPQGRPVRMPDGHT